MLVYRAYEAPKWVGQIGSWILVDSRLEEKIYMYFNVSDWIEEIA